MNLPSAMGARTDSGSEGTKLSVSAGRASASSRLGGRATRPGLHEVNGEGEDDGRAALAGDVEERGEVAKLHRLRHRRQNASGVEQLLRRLLLAFGVDDLGAARALGLRLAGDGADHAFVEIYALDL